MAEEKERGRLAWWRAVRGWLERGRQGRLFSSLEEEEELGED